jgi:hypothetical protein
VINRNTLINAAMIAVIAVAALFFFHFNSGSFSATHGPVTTMRASRQATEIKMGIAFFAAIVVVAVVRCWLFTRIAKDNTEASAPPLAPPLEPPIRV